jgi:hypothetical protein
MSTVYADTLEPSVPTKNTTLGATGDSITIGANSINTNVIQDSGGNVLFQSDGSGTLSNVNSDFAANLKLLSTQTASGSSSIDITSGIDSTYDVYIFTLTDINPATDNTKFQFQFNASGGSGWDETVTTTRFRARHTESDLTSFGYEADYDQAQGTGFIDLGIASANDSESCQVGELYLFAPSSTTYVKHFYSRVVVMANEPGIYDTYVAGYINTTSAIDEISFKMNSGNFDGVIKMYGL